MPPPAPTARLVFRSWREDDLPLAQALFGDSRVNHVLYVPTGLQHPCYRLAP